MTSGKRQIVPTTLTVVQKGSFGLLALEVMNSTNSAITFAAYDNDGLCVVPSQIVQAAGVITYLSAVAAPVEGGMSWIASAPGLVGWYKMA